MAQETKVLSRLVYIAVTAVYPATGRPPLLWSALRPYYPWLLNLRKLYSNAFQMLM